MRYRKLSPSGDYTFGHQQADFWINVPQAVAQAVQTRLELQLGSWYLDTTAGTDWSGKVLGYFTAATRDALLRSQILQTQGVTEITSFSSSFDPVTRAYRVSVTLDTQYGPFGSLQVQLQTPGSMPSIDLPEPPVDVAVNVLNQNQVIVSWQPYSPP